MRSRTLTSRTTNQVITLAEHSKARAEHLEAWLGDLLAELEDLMHERGTKYGPGNIAEFGDFGAVVRMSDKFARLRNLYVEGAGGDVRDESVEDTLMDIANYAVIILAWRRGLWPGSEKNKPDPAVDFCICQTSTEQRLCDNCEICGLARCNHKPEDMHAFISEEQ